MADPYTAGGLQDDITILNSHYFPESLPSSTVNAVKRSRECQKRLEELLSSGKKPAQKVPDLKSHFPVDNHSKDKKWNGQDTGLDEFSSPVPGIYWDCGNAGGFLKKGHDAHGNAVINLLKMFIP